jgi:zinc transporter ZupT
MDFMFELALSLSIVGLLIGPALASWARGHASVVTVLDAATLGIALPLLVLRMIPHLVDEVGPLALAAVAAGYAGFSVLGTRHHAHAARLGAALLVPMLAIHSFLDGAALAVAFEQGVTAAAGWALGAAVVLHRLPEGIVLASLLLPAHGLRGTLLRMSVLAAFTVIGSLVGRALLAHTADHALHLVVAVGLGVMLGMILHRHRHADAGAGAPRRWREGIVFVVSAVLAIAVVELTSRGTLGVFGGIR